MFLMGAGTAFRGESSRILTWSDLFQTKVIVSDIKQGFTIPILAALANNAKHNQYGRLDEHGIMRHRHVDVCPVGALALLFFAIFHVLQLPSPAFAPDLTDPSYGQHGRRDWYQYLVFFVKKPDQPMTYESKSSSFYVTSNELISLQRTDLASSTCMR